MIKFLLFLGFVVSGMFFVQEYRIQTIQQQAQDLGYQDQDGDWLVNGKKLDNPYKIIKELCSEGD